MISKIISYSIQASFIFETSILKTIKLEKIDPTSASTYEIFINYIEFF